MSATTTQPWYNATDTWENNERAKNAYSAMLTVIAKQLVNDEYIQFSQELKDLAETKYNYTFPNDEPVSTFVTAFYDAVLLYAYALNDSIAADPKVLYHPLNGTKLTHLMWNRSFHGITGNVTIDRNGDRISDYSLLDMNPETGYFHVVANYYNSSGLEFVAGRTIHWAGGRTEPPLDKPVCGYDNSLCPDNCMFVQLVHHQRHSIDMFNSYSFAGICHSLTLPRRRHHCDGNCNIDRLSTLQIGGRNSFDGVASQLE